MHRVYITLLWLGLATKQQWYVVMFKNKTWLGLGKDCQCLVEVKHKIFLDRIGCVCDPPHTQALSSTCLGIFSFGMKVATHHLFKSSEKLPWWLYIADTLGYLLHLHVPPQAVTTCCTWTISAWKRAGDVFQQRLVFQHTKGGQQ